MKKVFILTIAILLTFNITASLADLCNDTLLTYKSQDDLLSGENIYWDDLGSDTRPIYLVVKIIDANGGISYASPLVGYSSWSFKYGTQAGVASSVKYDNMPSVNIYPSAKSEYNITISNLTYPTSFKYFIEESGASINIMCGHYTVTYYSVIDYSQQGGQLPVKTLSSLDYALYFNGYFSFP